MMPIITVMMMILPIMETESYLSRPAMMITALSAIVLSMMLTPLRMGLMTTCHAPSQST
jgi:hypothetical protein